jgi:hypothetical protein
MLVIGIRNARDIILWMAQKRRADWRGALLLATNRCEASHACMRDLT